MLQELAIRNFAIIDDIRMCFDGGFTVLSGETGAGKSIIINAVNLLLGARATARMVRTGADEAELEALFDVPPGSIVATRMADQNLNPADGLLIRRIISAKDRHRIYINGRLSTLQTLTDISDSLASISGQHAHQTLLREEAHLVILDQFGDLVPLRMQMEALFQQMTPLIEKRERLLNQARRQAEEMEFLEFQLQEILDASPEPEEDVALDAERRRLRNAESLMQTASVCVDMLYADAGSVTERLGEAGKRLEGLVRFDGELVPLAEQLEDIRCRVEDVTASLRDYLSRQELDPSRLDAVEARLDRLNRLKRKHGGSLEAVIGKQAALTTALADLNSLDERIQVVTERLGDVYQEASKAALSLSGRRLAVADDLAPRVEAELASLKMPETRFAVHFDHYPLGKDVDPRLQVDGRQLKPWGVDRVAFFISPNPGEALKPLAAIASGGELSRVVLALKSILAVNDAVETVVFDEVDAGIGGGAAEMVGRKLKALAERHQVICITHLPQIARFANHHFRIVKEVRGGGTATTITPLDAKQRIEEIARMLGGTRITAKTRAHAKEMLATGN